MSASNAFETSLLGLIFTNVAAANIGDATGLPASATAGSFYISLHTATLADTDSAQTTSEATYTSYARVAVARSTAEWTVTAGTVVNDNAIVFPACTGSTNTITDFAVGQASTSTGGIQFYGALTSSLAVSTGITPQYAAGAFQISVN
jgi:hypothetical protein